MGRIYALTFILLLSVPGCLSAQNYLEPEIISIEDGLSSHRVNDIAIDDVGFLWAATEKGLNRYDGYEFKQFLVPLSSFPTQESHEVNRLSIDEVGNIWFLSSAGPGVYASETGRITLFDNNQVAYNGEPASAIRDQDMSYIDIAAGKDMTAWVLSDTALLHLNPDGQSESYAYPQKLAGNVIVPTCLAADESYIWIGYEAGALSFNLQNRSFMSIDLPARQQSLNGPMVHSLFVDLDNTVWFGTADGLIRFDPVEIDIKDYYPEGSRRSSPGNEIFDIEGMKEESLILVTGAGVKIFDKESLQFRDVGNANDNILHAGVSDAAGNIWIASSRGIVKFRWSNLAVVNYTSQSRDLRLASDQVISLQTLPGNNLWVGYRDGFDIISTQTLTKRYFRMPSGEEIRGFSRGLDDQMIILSRHNVIYYSKNGSKLYTLAERFPFIDEELLSGSDINCILEDQSDRIWIGTSTGVHLLQTRMQSHTFLRYLQGDGDTIRLYQVHDIKMDAEGNLWFGSDDGLILYRPEQQLATKFTPYDRTLLNTEAKGVFTILQQDLSTYWIGTSRGLLSFNINNKEFTAPDNPKLMNASVYSITPDQSGNLWIGSDTGLLYYIPLSSSLFYFNPVDGLINYAYTSSAMDEDGRVYAGGEHGLSLVHVAIDEQEAVIQRVVITGVYWIDQTAKSEVYYAVPDTVVLPLTHNALQINFAVLDLSRPEDNDFSYTFAKAGKNTGPFKPVTDHQVILNPLSRGKYVLILRGSNSNMVKTREDTTLVIMINPTFWRSGTALILYGILIALVLFFGFMKLSYWSSKMNQQGKEKELIAKQILEQKEELSLKNKSITDSINYAKRIQTAMLPPFKMLKTDFPSSFILYMPKDIVSGDFYWINKMDEKIFVAAVDCTGHGVPGAFMSIIGFELFRKITSQEGLKRPSDILNRLNEDFHEIFKDVDVVLRDGMDVAFCSIDKSNKILEFSGAFNPLYLIRDNKITEIKGDRFAIGLDEIDFMEQTFKNHLVPLQEGDIIYIFSDGFADQFGGPDGKKYKYRRFKHLLLNMHQLEMEKQREILESNVVEWRGEQEQVDDILIIGIKIDF